MAEATKATKTATKQASTAEGFSVFETGGKQYLATVGTEIKIEKLAGDNKVGDKVVFDNVVLTDDGKATQVGAPYVSGAKVEAEVVAVGRAPKINVIKYKAKVNYFKKRGHRQPFLKVKVSKI
jgi:large subunit ribosomal protein L21